MAVRQEKMTPARKAQLLSKIVKVANGRISECTLFDWGITAHEEQGQTQITIDMIVAFIKADKIDD